MRDVMVFGGMLILAALALTNAFAAYLLWGWTSVIAIDSYLYGFMTAVRLNLIVALLALTVLFVGNDRGKGKPMQTRTLVLVILFMLQATLSVIFAYDENPLNWNLYEQLLKNLLFVVLMPLVVTSRYRIHAMVVMLCLGVAFHGLLDGLKFFSSGGAHIVRGPAKFGDNNHFAVAIVMAIPLLFYLSRYSASRLVRLTGVGCTLVTIAAVVGTHSRGGFIALLAAALWWILTGRRKLQGMVLFGVGIGVAVLLAPSSWSNRMETIKDAEEDSSFMARVEAWQVSSAIAIANPLVGGGLHAVQVQSVWNRFRGETGLLGFVGAPRVPAQIFRAAHSIYFEILGDLGFIGFFLFCAILVNAIVTGIEIRRLAARAGPEYEWAADLSRALVATIFAFMVGGASVSIAYSETIYIIVMLMEMTKQRLIAVADSAAALPDHVVS